MLKLINPYAINVDISVMKLFLLNYNNKNNNSLADLHLKSNKYFLVYSILVK